MTNNPPKVWGYSWGNQQTLAQKSRSPDQIFQAAIGAYQRGDFAGAVSLCRQIPANAVQFGDALNLWAAAASANGRRDEAAGVMAQLVALVPAHPIIQANFGAILGPSYPPAAAPLRRAVQLDPHDSAARVNLAIALASGSDRSAAIIMFAVAAILAPDFFDIWFNLGSHDKNDRTYQRAVSHLGRALRLNPAHFDARTQFAQSLSELARHDAALENLQQLTLDHPKSALALTNLAAGFQAAQKYDEALSAYDRAIELDPDHAQTRYNRACLLLARGDYQNGFAEYEWRWRTNTASQHNHVQPIWRGEDLSGRSIWLHAEQGFGDCLQFVRFAHMVKNLGANVFLGVQAPLAPLIQNSLPDVTVISTGGLVPSVDCHCPLMSLPHILNLSLDTIPAAVPYLVPPAERVAHWSGQMVQPGRLCVGLAWSGNPEHENDRNRSMTLATLAPLLELQHIDFYILQKGLSDLDQAAIANHPNLYNGGFDFTETAALMNNLDLVISVDTSIAHLAGALGLPAWVLLAIPCDWRWLHERMDSPWYPTMQLFRQVQAGDWSPVLSAIRQQLLELVQTKRRDGA